MVVSILILLGCSGTGKTKIGTLGSTHRHADIKVYVLGNAMDFSAQKYQLKAKEAHFEHRDGDVVHIHATGIILGYVFLTLGMNIGNECLILDTGNEYCNDEKAELEVFVKSAGMDWEQIYDPSDYLIQNLDKILVTYGTEDGEGIKKQMESVTDKAAGV